MKSARAQVAAKRKGGGGGGGGERQEAERARRTLLCVRLSCVVAAFETQRWTFSSRRNSRAASAFIRSSPPTKGRSVFARPLSSVSPTASFFAMHSCMPSIKSVRCSSIQLSSVSRDGGGGRSEARSTRDDRSKGVS